MKKITNVSALEAVINMVMESSCNVMQDFSNDELIEKLQTMQTTFTKKNTSSRKPTAQQVENDRLRGEIMNLMQDGVVRNSADIRDGIGLPVETTPQRIAGLIKPLVVSHQLITHEIKRKRFYSIPGVEPAE